MNQNKMRKRLNKKQMEQDFSSEECLQEFIRFLQQEVDYLNEARTRCLNEKVELWNVLNPLLFAACDSLNSVVWLTKSYKVRDSYVASRTVIETLVNICFICVEGKTAIDHAVSHARQKSFRDLERVSEVSTSRIELIWSGKRI